MYAGGGRVLGRAGGRVYRRRSAGSRTVGKSNCKRDWSRNVVNILLGPHKDDLTGIL